MASVSALPATLIWGILLEEAHLGALCTKRGHAWQVDLCSVMAGKQQAATIVLL